MTNESTAVAERRQIKELECESRRKHKALAETAALLVLYKTLGNLPQERRRMIAKEDRLAGFTRCRTTVLSLPDPGYPQSQNRRMRSARGRIR